MNNLKRGIVAVVVVVLSTPALAYAEPGAAFDKADSPIDTGAAISKGDTPRAVGESISKGDTPRSVGAKINDATDPIQPLPPIRFE